MTLVNRRALVVLIAAPCAPLHAQAGSEIRHALVTVAANSSSWTPSLLPVEQGDLLIVRVRGTVGIGHYLGKVDATGSWSGKGVLEYRIGGGAGTPAGIDAIHVAASDGAVEFRVRDTRYDDNAGAFQVEVITIPSTAIPVATTPEQQAGAVGIMKRFLRELVTAQEAYFSDHTQYANSLRDLGVPLPDDVTLENLFVPASGGMWTATLRHASAPSVACGIAINTRNPVSPAAGDGTPACR